MLFYDQPTDPWTEYDFKILEAYQILQDETCPSCGNPTWLCRSESNRIGWKVKSTTCYATKELMKAENSRRPDKDREKDRKVISSWGTSHYAVPYVPPNLGGDLPSRFEYFDSLSTIE